MGRFIRPACLLSLLLVTASCGDTGTNPTDAPTLRLEPGSLSFDALGESQSLAASLSGAAVSGNAVSWSVEDAAVATVDGSGMVTSVGNGTTRVTATSGGASAAATVTVAQRAASVEVSPETADIGAGATIQLSATLRDRGGREMSGASLQWSSSETAIATVNAQGLVTGVGAGTTDIRVASGSVSGTARITVGSDSGSCSAGGFTHALIDPSVLRVVAQIGVVGGANTELVGRTYLMPQDGDGVRLPLVAPADMRIVGAKHYIPSGAPAGYDPDWSLYIETGCGPTLELYHVKDVAPEIKAAMDTTISSASGWQPLPQAVPFAAGATFGWYFRGINSVAFDLIAHEPGRRNQFANQARYETLGSNLLDVVCPWDLFSAEIRDRYLAIVGAPTGQRYPGAGCGTVERDVAGTPAGQWFRSEAIGSSWVNTKDGHYGDPLPIILGVDETVYIGHIGPSNDIRITRQNPTWKDPATVTTSWCYQTEAGSEGPSWLWLRMTTATRMDVMYGSGSACPAAFPESGWVSYYR